MANQLPNFIPIIEESIKANWDLDAFTDYEGATLQYKDLARKIEKLHILFENSGVKKGDKIALFGRNCSNWGAAFFAILTYGAVAVPILHEFKPDTVHHIVNHSDAKLLFAGDQVYPTLDANVMPNLEGIINIQDYSLLVCRSEKLNDARENLNAMFGSKYPKYFRKEHVHYEIDDPEGLAMINYTSGSTGNSKGVMVPYRALTSNLLFARIAIPNVKHQKVISILPMAHMYGMMFEFIFEMSEGCHIYFLNRTPSPKIIFKAFQDVKPVIVISVPLIIEKVIKKAVLPKVETPTMKALMKLPVIGDKVKAKICQQVKEAFGNNFYEVIIGGAAFNQEIEKFLRDIKFPYTVGYGATEAAPILAYEDYKKFKLYSCGKAALNMELKINSADPENIVGEILAKGPNVMLGYYKNPEATAQTIDKDGWLHTGDLGTIDKEGNLTIKGRCKNMLLSASGQNVYPEEIEDKLNMLPYVSESVVVQRGEKFYGLVFPDLELIKKNKLNPEQVEKIMEDNRKTLNSVVANYEQISGIEIREEEFEKTPKKSIKRYLYS